MDALWLPEPGHKRVTTAPYSELSSETFKEQHTSKRIRHYPKRSLANETGKGLSQLPTEIIDCVYQNFCDLVTVLCFAATCQRHYEIGRRHIEALVSATFVNLWAGNRLICLGHYANMDDLPPGMLTDAERELIKCRFADEDKDSYRIYEQLAVLQQHDPLWHFRREIPVHRRFSYDSKNKLSSFFTKLAGYGLHDANMDMDSANVLRDLITVPAVKPPSTNETLLYGGAYVLRNLTSKEFIRGDAFRYIWRDPKHAFGLSVSFNHALIIRIAWSSDPSLSIVCNDRIKIHRGKWAGHRFDISGIESVRNEEGAVDGWKDVSQGVLNEVVEFWKGDDDEEELSDYSE
ncbi:hypothetical protein DXG03_003365 [Asterophora parasitica]|uniref:F-box domain-containing protein n=1 Tax=Asterophora parasitica TaxID=117018 RepID=A0A9P7KBW1_9AGAR|nr:hypothetical protein DXG03_003365 [Asterophora parasitica]